SNSARRHGLWPSVRLTGCDRQSERKTLTCISNDGDARKGAWCGNALLWRTPVRVSFDGVPYLVVDLDPSLLDRLIGELGKQFGRQASLAPERRQPRDHLGVGLHAVQHRKPVGRPFRRQLRWLDPDQKPARHLAVAFEE